MVVNILLGIYVGSFALYWLGTLAAALSVKATAEHYGWTCNSNFDSAVNVGRLLASLLQSIIPLVNTALGLILVLAHTTLVETTLEKYYD